MPREAIALFLPASPSFTSMTFALSLLVRYRRLRRNSLPLATALLSLFCILLVTVSLFSPAILEDALSATARQSVAKFFLPTKVRAAGYSPDFCDGPALINFLRSSNLAWLALLLPVIVFTFFGFAIVTDDYFVPALERICEVFYLSEDVAGTTFMAAGSSAPQLFMNLQSVFFAGDDIGIDTVVGSAMFNILIINGLSVFLRERRCSWTCAHF